MYTCSYIRYTDLITIHVDDVLFVLNCLNSASSNLYTSVTLPVSKIATISSPIIFMHAQVLQNAIMPCRPINRGAYGIQCHLHVL